METNTKMKPDKIKAALKEKKITIAGIARDLEKSTTAIQLVISGDSVSHEIRTHIAKCIDLPVGEVFSVKKNPTQKGRPVTKGLHAA